MPLEFAKIADDATKHLQNLIRLNTTNPPGNDTPAVEYVAGACREAGIEAEVVESAPGRGNAVARIRSANPIARPLMLMGHVDVVGVEAEKWERDPFGGELVDGYIWGRGALDMKGQVAAELAAFIAIKQAGVELDRDLILVAIADEETGSPHHGTEWMWANRRDLVDAEYALNEGGGIQAAVGSQRFYLCQVGEKGASRLRITARGPAGHASVPLEDTAMTRLGEALVRLSKWRSEIILTPPQRQLLQTVAPSFGEQGAAAVAAFLTDPTWEAFEQFPLDSDLRAELNASMSNTAVPTMLKGGVRINVIPSEVSVDVDGRILPGEDPERFRATIQKAIGDVAEVTLISRESGIASDAASPLFDAIAETIAELDPGCGVAPCLTTGGTDAKAIPGVKVYGFCPIASIERQNLYMSLIHGHNERVHVDDLAYAARFFVNVVVRFSGT
jgi:acetylornithine deacetylase/succinyl-diaminopimelate desuccinylase-like protein